MFSKVDGLYQGLRLVRYVAENVPDSRFGRPSVGVAAFVQGGRVTLTVDGQELTDHHPQAPDILCSIIQMDRWQVQWSKVGLGASRIWVAPQAAFGKSNNGEGAVPFTELDLGEYTISEQPNGELLMISPLDIEAGLQIERRIRITPAGLVSCSQIHNLLKNRVQIAPWELMQVRPPRYITVEPLCKPPMHLGFNNPLNIPEFATENKAGQWRLDFTKDVQMLKLGFNFSRRLGGFGRIVADYSDADIPFQLIAKFKLSDGRFPHAGQAEVFLWPNTYCEIEMLAGIRNIAHGCWSAALPVEYAIEYL